MTDTRQTAFWDSAAASKGFHHPLNLELFGSLVGRDKRIVELGCGYGRVLSELAAAGYTSLAGFDPSPGMIARGSKEFPELDLCIWPDGPVPLESGSADAVLLFAVLTCIAADDGQLGVIREAYRLLRPGGVLYVSDYCIQTDERNRVRYEKWLPVHGTYGVFELESGAVMRHIARGRFEELTAGMDKIALEEIELLTMNGNPARAFQYLGRKRAEE